MKVLVVSDTHGRDESLEMAVALEQPFDYLIHCGDVEGREFFIEALAECPCTIVAGNNDFFSDLPREDEILLEGHKIMGDSWAQLWCVHGSLWGFRKRRQPEAVRLFALDIPISQWWRRKMVYW